MGLIMAKRKSKPVPNEPTDLRGQNLRFILVLSFVPVIILAIVLAVAFLFVTVATGELPPGDALLSIAKSIMDFIISLLEALVS